MLYFLYSAPLKAWLQPDHTSWRSLDSAFTTSSLVEIHEVRHKIKPHLNFFPLILGHADVYWILNEETGITMVKHELRQLRESVELLEAHLNYTDARLNKCMNQPKGEAK